MLKKAKNMATKIKSSTRKKLAIISCFLLSTPFAFADPTKLKDGMNMK